MIPRSAVLFQKLRNSFRSQLDGTEGIAGLDKSSLDDEFDAPHKASAANSATVLVDAKVNGTEKALEANNIEISKF